MFNSAQVDLALPTTDTPVDMPPPVPLPAFDAFVAATGAQIREGGTRASYVPATDMIHLPHPAAFRTATGYAGTLAHELVHWTGAPHRLARDLTSRFGARAYAAEELVAELGAAFVLADLGFARTPHPDHAAYCASWAPLLRADPRALSHVAAQGSRAADYLTALQPDSAGPERTENADLTTDAGTKRACRPHRNPATHPQATAETSD
ncbi:zincin-like metallopeptidase domain-containing protein [Methylobacterium sp. Leaf99]|uniref:zincin-like metallopeptidase domain-containing protein n=1 Tax=Methylobacterium sp. Leaf99 TaxID=1736251 RepID=UPI000A53ACA5|nr:zincin-like metallopeptidase domain-containing protein [Methylobacterium sp. Leaf99]